MNVYIFSVTPLSVLSCLFSTVFTNDGYVEVEAESRQCVMGMDRNENGNHLVHSGHSMVQSLVLLQVTAPTEVLLVVLPDYSR